MKTQVPPEKITPAGLRSGDFIIVEIEIELIDANATRTKEVLLRITKDPVVGPGQTARIGVAFMTSIERFGGEGRVDMLDVSSSSCVIHPEPTQSLTKGAGTNGALISVIMDRHVTLLGGNPGKAHRA